MRQDLPLDALARLVGQQRGHLFPWIPVCLGLGIACYFAQGVEPGLALYGGTAALALAAGLAARLLPEGIGPPLTAIMLVALGFLLAGYRAHAVAGPVLDFRYYGPIEGRVVALDRSISDVPRVTLDRVVLLRTAPSRTPVHVRVSLHGDQPFDRPLPGQRVAVTGHLSPPSGPVEPHGFDFQRMAWFMRIGAVGYARTPMVLLAEPQGVAPRAAIDRLRLRLSGAVQTALPDQRGAFAAAVTTGDRAALSRETLDAMRDTNLAHLLAISGLHVGLLTGFIFMAVRAGLALVPRVALRVPTKKLAAGVALVASAAYLAMSGGNVSTQRAFIMAAVMLVAVMCDRRALTLRSVALAAVIVLLWQPEALLSPGFQMSFAATAALVWVFGQVRDRRRGLPKWSRGAAALVMSSAVAGLATAPFGAAHFNQSSTYGLIANLVAVPAMGAVVIPSAVLAACLAPFGLAYVGLWAMGMGIGWILAVADVVAAWPHAVRYVPQPGPVVLPIIVLGALVVMLWQGRGRWTGIVPVLAALALWLQTERPLLLVSADGGLVGARTQEGRALSRARGQGFVAQSWLENDGGDRDREAAFARAGRLGAPIPGGLALPFGTAHVAALFSPDPAEIAAACADFPLAITNRAPEEPPPEGCHLLGPDWLERVGGIAISPVRSSDPQWHMATTARTTVSSLLGGATEWDDTPPALHVRTVRDAHGLRLWNDRATRDAGPGWHVAWNVDAPPAEPDPAVARLVHALAPLVHVSAGDIGDLPLPAQPAAVVDAAPRVASVPGQ
ncbi:ComEC/Rec2 family competence protein [Meridianimarinicoccus sp. RP-17]|uniref:ComEC/Rec2 family competence protein n=1 Tax=Meridianimarinicoccus zhengii TaxID=2056810 RepID=UPI000DAEF37D|nr:ComEC/Rec2 family competence protein [Phycocomes zhengii]